MIEYIYLFSYHISMDYVYHFFHIHRKPAGQFSQIKYPAASNGVFGLRFATVGAKRVPLAHSAPRHSPNARAGTAPGSLLAGINGFYYI